MEQKIIVYIFSNINIDPQSIQKMFIVVIHSVIQIHTHYIQHEDNVAKLKEQNHTKIEAMTSIL